MYFDKDLFLSINNFARRTPGLHGLMLFLANEGIVLFMIILFVAYLFVRFKSKWTTLDNITKIVVSAVGTLIGLGVNQPIAHLFKEQRPYNELGNILVLIHRVNDYSFPSDHGVMIGAVTAGLFLIDPLLGAISLFVGLAVAFARVYTAAHYPHDLVVGILLGAAITLICYALLKKPVQWILGYLNKTPLKIFLGTDK